MDRNQLRESIAKQNIARARNPVCYYKISHVCCFIAAADKFYIVLVVLKTAYQPPENSRDHFGFQNVVQEFVNIVRSFVLRADVVNN